MSVYRQPHMVDSGNYLVIDVPADAVKIGGHLRAFMTGQCGGREEWEDDADKAFDALDADTIEWCESNVDIEIDEDECPCEPEVFPHDIEPDEYTGGGIAITLLGAPPAHVLTALRERALAYGQAKGVEILGLRLVKKTVTITTTFEVG